MLEPLGRAPIQALIAAVRTSSRHHASYAGGREAGGASRDRTGDLLVANQALSQLSYGPSLIRCARLAARKPGGSGRSCTSDLTLIRGARGPRGCRVGSVAQLVRAHA